MLPSPVRALTQQILARRLAYIMLVRVILFTLVLGGVVAVNLAWGTPEELGGPYVTVLFVFIAAIYVLNICYAMMLRMSKRLVSLAVVQIAVDLITSASLVHFTGGADSAYVIFFLLSPITAAVTLSRRAALVSAALGLCTLILTTGLGFAGLLPVLPGQRQLPWDMTLGSLARGSLLYGGAMIAIAALSGYLAEQLRSVALRVEVQQAHIGDLAALNANVIRCLTSGLLTVTVDGIVLSANQAALEMLELDADPTGHPLADISPELAQAAAASNELRRGELKIARGGETQVLGVSVSPLLDHHGETSGRIVNFQDLTSYRQLEQSIKRSERLASIGRLAAGIAHEVRNPLASISGSLELLQVGTETKEDRRLMEIAMREIDRLNTLITDFLDFARPKPPTLAPIDLPAEICRLAGVIGELASGENSLQIEVISRCTNAWVEADVDQLNGILWNLINNAKQASESAKPIKVTIEVEKTAHDVTLSVTDNGDGISGDDLQNIFEPFFTTKDEGTGLGLATVHRIVEDHRGTIEVSSRLGEGTRFSISLPIASPPLQP